MTEEKLLANVSRALSLVPRTERDVARPRGGVLQPRP